MRSFVAFGGNLGFVADTFRSAAERLAQLPTTRIITRSRLFSTTPIGVKSANNYLNAVAAITTELPPDELLARLHEIEHDFGRRRTGRWGPRTLDLDLLAYGDVVSDRPELMLPHPHCWYRRFVLDPWCDIAPGYVLPNLKESVGALLKRMKQRPLPVAALNDIPSAEVTASIAAVPEVEPHHDRSSDVAIIFSMHRGQPHERVIDVSRAADPAVYALDVLRSALDEPMPVTDATELPRQRG
ncbi:MAG TPA: 2-amino-4-hydroxy-6-hydroxymethyldihydropteridine diphosphokinase [Caulifigura sp.]|jgi:2-amino-4-hydroxy-6-hydroxymethyldihydropteridine diphosphokinase|nr:2-amino-4-hydroxy-6-hydroxymethyldihydropteridine diphosphokinase [Caulifigura sp.]